jgi:hypothetical protein
MWLLSGRRDYARQRFFDSAPNKAEIMAPLQDVLVDIPCAADARLLGCP